MFVTNQMMSRFKTGVPSELSFCRYMKVRPEGIIPCTGALRGKFRGYCVIMRLQGKELNSVFATHQSVH